MKIKDFLNNPKFSSLSQFIKFCLVGVSNTLISYGIDMLCFYILFAFCEFESLIFLLAKMGVTASNKIIKVVFSSALAFFVSVINSYLLNNRFVFKSGNSTLKQHLKSFFKTLLSYGITGLVISPLIKSWLTGFTVVNFKIPYSLASFGTLLVTVPINFILNKFWAFKNKKQIL